MTYPFWLKLLRANKSYGLTLPFLAGAMRSPVGSVLAGDERNISAIRELLESIRDETPDNSWVKLGICDVIHQPVFAECSGYFKPSPLYVGIPRSGSEECFLYIDQSIGLNPAQNNVEDLLDVLWVLNGKAILSGAFSFSNGGFAKYAETDLAVISSACQVIANEDGL